jgi:hypothetical protein
MGKGFKYRAWQAWSGPCHYTSGDFIRCRRQISFGLGAKIALSLACGTENSIK